MGALTRRVQEIVWLLRGHGVSALVAMTTAELFYKLHSFTLEALAFLATWYAIDVIFAAAPRPLARWLRLGRPA